MKVKVFVKTVAPTKEEKYLQDIIDELHAELAAAEAEIEKLFQENKDLRVGLSHTQDELRVIRQQSEVRRQKLAEKDALIAELNEQIEAGEQEIENLVADVQVKMEIQEELGDKVAELRSELHDRNARIDELEQRNQWLESMEEVRAQEKAEMLGVMRQSAEQWRIKYEAEHRAYEEDKAKADAICKSCDEVYQRTLKERDEYKAQAEKMEKRAAFNRHLFEVSESELKDRKEEVAALDRRVFELESSNDELRYSLEEAERRIAEQQRTITDAGETISNLRQCPIPRTLSDLIMEVLHEN